MGHMVRKSATRSTEATFAGFMASHEGVASRWELEALGLGRDAITKRARSGRLHRVHQGVYALHSSLTSRGHARAAVLACGNGAVLSHRSAAHLHGLFRAGPQRIEITIPTSNGRKTRPGITLHRCALSATEVTNNGCLPLTSLARTLLDVAEVVPHRILIAAIDRAEELRILDLNQVQADLDAHPHRHGAAKLTKAIAEYAQGPVLRSILERDFLALCHKHQLPIPHTNRTLGPYEADFHWPEHRLIAETDGRAHHARRKAFTKDRVRDAELLADGWRTVRFTYAQVVHEAAWVAGILRRALTRAARA